jgi:hypothetical protein
VLTVSWMWPSLAVSVRFLPDDDFRGRSKVPKLNLDVEQLLLTWLIS